MDEVLKDLELNSQDLNEHLSMEHETLHSTAKNIVELPITIQKNIKIDQYSSSMNTPTNNTHNSVSSPLFNKSSNFHHQQPIPQQINNMGGYQNSNVANYSKWNHQYSEPQGSRGVGPYGGSKILNSTGAPPNSINTDSSGNYF